MLFLGAKHADAFSQMKSSYILMARTDFIPLVAQAISNHKERTCFGIAMDFNQSGFSPVCLLCFRNTAGNLKSTALE